MNAFLILKKIVEKQKTVTTKRLAELVLEIGKYMATQSKTISSQKKTIEKLNKRCQQAEARVKYLERKGA
jgi:hypothetical protein